MTKKERAFMHSPLGHDFCHSKCSILYGALVIFVVGSGQE